MIALISGGKDSTMNMMECVREGHEIVALVNLRPPNSLSVQNERNDSNNNLESKKNADQPELVQELDSYMYQSVGNEIIELYSKAMELPLYRAEITGKVLNQKLEYSPEECGQADEVEDLYRILKTAKEELEAKHGYKVEGVSSGAILSTYQKNRVENICSRLGMTSLAYLWSRNQRDLLANMIDSGINAILIKVACAGLKPSKHLGKSLSEMMPLLLELEAKYGCNVCGEGGEYESLTLDCPLFKHKRIVVEDSEMKIHSECEFAPVGYLIFTKFSLVDK